MDMSITMVALGVEWDVEVIGLDAHYERPSEDCPGGWEIDYTGLRVGGHDVDPQLLTEADEERIIDAIIDALEAGA